MNEYRKTTGLTLCGCCYNKAHIITDNRYNGLRGLCLTCGNNWPES